MYANGYTPNTAEKETVMSTRTTLTAKAGALAVAAVIALGACSTVTETASDTSVTDTTVAAVEASIASGSAAAVSQSEASASTELSAGTYTATVEGTEIAYQAAYLVDGIDVVIDGGTYEASDADEVVFLVVNGGSLTITDATVSKSGEATSTDAERTADVSDDYNFYGMNSAIVVVGDGSSVTIDGTTITTSANGANAVIVVDGGIANVTNTSITTTEDLSRGLHATYGGTIIGTNLTIDTAGAHSAAVATDRGGGTVTVTGTNTFNTAGDGSPLVYSTGEIMVSGVTGTAETSEVVVVEGKNTATIVDSDVTSIDEHALMIYQSMSGDAADSDAAGSVGAVLLQNTSITFTGSGAVFYFTNTSAELTLTNVALDTDSSLLAAAQEDNWGTSGSNGADASITISGSSLTGDIEAGSSSSIDVVTTDGGSVTGSTGGSVTIS